MFSKNGFGVILSIIVSLLSLLFAIFVYLKKPSIGYINNDKVLSQYKGLIVNKQQYESKVKNWQANLDTLSVELQKNIEDYKNTSFQMSVSAKKQREEFLQSKERELVTYKNALEQKAKAEEIELTKGVINQVNAYILEYGKSQNYDYILGATDNGSIQFAREGDDLTDEVIEYINLKYSGK